MQIIITLGSSKHLWNTHLFLLLFKPLRKRRTPTILQIKLSYYLQTDSLLLCGRPNFWPSSRTLRLWRKILGRRRIVKIWAKRNFSCKFPTCSLWYVLWHPFQIALSHRNPLKCAKYSTYHHLKFCLKICSWTIPQYPKLSFVPFYCHFCSIIFVENCTIFISFLTENP